jgi:uncharacterized membrane protein YbhN (UPF0104 family)
MIQTNTAVDSGVIPSIDLINGGKTLDNPRLPRPARFITAGAAKLFVSIALLGGAVAWVTLHFNTTAVFAGVHRLSSVAVTSILVSLFLNVLAAALRLKIIANDIGSPISFRQALATVSASSLAGAAFFQLAGQLIARGILMGRSGVPFASVVVVTAYERTAAAVVSGLLALAGAYLVFGQVVLDLYAGGDQLIKIVGGLFAATIAGAVVGHGGLTWRLIAPFMKPRIFARILRVAGLSLIVQLPMMVAYIAVAHALSPQTAIADIAAASAIVMFAASVPISLAGWGVREMSAVFVLGAIGMGSADALVAAVVVGAGSMLTMAVTAIFCLRGSAGENRTQVPARGSIDYARPLAFALPLGAATYVLFQIYIPMPSGTLLNVNLADPFAILSASLFLLMAFRSGHLPKWRFLHLNAAVAAATLVLAASLVYGAAAFGWTQWALVNRFFGWFVLLAFATTGALIVKDGGERALRIFLLTFAGATAAVAAMEIVLSILSTSGFSLPVVTFSVLGFALNHNFFAFQLLMALSATVVAARAAIVRITLMTILIAGLWYCGSRSAWVTLPFVVGTSIYLRASKVREIAIATTFATVVALIPVGLAVVIDVQRALPAGLPNEMNTAERMSSIFGGLKLFADHPIFGAGLGAFRNKMIFVSSDQPLLIHSTIVWLLAETGIVGFLIFFVPASFVFVGEIRRGKPDIASKLIVLSFVVFGCMSGPADMLYQRTFWLLIGAALALPEFGQSRDQKRAFA